MWSTVPQIITNFKRSICMCLVSFLVQQFISNNIWHRHLHISIFTFLPPLKIFYQLWTSSVQINFCGSGEKKRAQMHTIYTDTAVQHPKVALLTWKKRSVWVLGWEGGCRADGRHVSHVRDVMNGSYRTYGRHTHNIGNLYKCPYPRDIGKRA